MAGPTFSVGESIAAGWREVTGRLGFWIGVVVVFFAAVIGPDALATLLGQTGRPLGLVLGIVGILVQALVQAGMIDLALRAVDGRELRVGLLFGRTDVLLRYLVASIFFGLAVGIGLIFLLIPGIIVFVLFFFYGHEIVSEDAGIGAALEGSMDLTKGRRLDIFLLLLLLMVINVVGAMLLLVGLLVTLPLASVAAAHAYRSLQALHGRGSEAGAGDVTGPGYGPDQTPGPGYGQGFNQ